MANNYVSPAKLMTCLVGGLLLSAGVPATAGILFTVDVMHDFVVTEDASLDYHPDFEAVNDIAQTETFSAPDDDVDLYLTRSDLGGSSQVSFEILQTSNENDSTGGAQTLLAGVLESMRGNEGNGYLDFLVKDDSVSGDLVKDYGGKGLAVRVAGLDGDRWRGVYSSLKNPVSSQVAASGPAGGGVPAAPAPGTLALLLAAGIPLLTMRRRG